MISSNVGNLVSARFEEIFFVWDVKIQEFRISEVFLYLNGLKKTGDYQSNTSNLKKINLRKLSLWKQTVYWNQCYLLTFLQINLISRLSRMILHIWIQKPVMSGCLQASKHKKLLFLSLLSGKGRVRLEKLVGKPRKQRWPIDTNWGRTRRKSGEWFTIEFA